MSHNRVIPQLLVYCSHHTIQSSFVAKQNQYARVDVTVTTYPCNKMHPDTFYAKCRIYM